MTDGQSFYLVLVIFYLIECIKFAPPGSIALTSWSGAFGNCSPRQPLMMAWGFKKTVLLAPVPPSPCVMYLVSDYKEKRRANRTISTVSGVRRHQKLLHRSCKTLRGLAALNLLNFFALLPLVYVFAYDENLILLTLAGCYLCLFATAFHYRVLHKRLLPSFEADRLKTTLYTALLPWHAPRCYDEITLKSSLRWDPLAALAANASNPSTLALLKQHWRNAHYLGKPTYSSEALTTALNQADIDTSTWLDAPKEFSSALYCPCCHAEYESPATHCSDCKDVPLVQTQPLDT